MTSQILRSDAQEDADDLLDGESSERKEPKTPDRGFESSNHTGEHRDGTGLNESAAASSSKASE